MLVKKDKDSPDPGIENEPTEQTQTLAELLSIYRKANIDLRELVKTVYL